MIITLSVETLRENRPTLKNFGIGLKHSITSQQILLQESNLDRCNNLS